MSAARRHIGVGDAAGLPEVLDALRRSCETALPGLLGAEENDDTAALQRWRSICLAAEVIICEGPIGMLGPIQPDFS